jgi:hypothetical protein
VLGFIDKWVKLFPFINAVGIFFNAVCISLTAVGNLSLWLGFWSVRLGMANSDKSLHTSIGHNFI